jgi:transcription elongation factor GreA
VKRARESLPFLDVMTMERVPMTENGYNAMVDEVRNLKSVERPRIIRAIEEARAHGDLSENAEYHAAKEAQGWNETRVAELEDKISRADVIDVSKLSGDTVMFGAKVTLIDEDTDAKVVYQIVGDMEADVKQGRISISSPISRAIIGKKQGDSVDVNTPGGGKSYEIAKVTFG